MVKKYAKSADQKVVAWQTDTVSFKQRKHIWISEELYHKLERKDSVRLLKNILEMMAKGKYDIYLVDDQEIHLPQEVYFSSLNESAMYIIYPGKGPTGNWYE